MRVTGCGCALSDIIYHGIDLDGAAINPFRSRTAGDGGITPGHLVLIEDFERFVGRPCDQALASVFASAERIEFNVGGPAIVALVLAAQLLEESKINVDYYGATGEDETAGRIRKMLRQTPLGTSHYVTRSGRTASTLVLSDPGYDDGRGERSFIHRIGASWEYGPEDLPASFYDSDLVLFGATAVVPKLHDGLGYLARNARSQGCLVVVTTVYDFISENRDTISPWPLGDHADTLRQIHLLIADHEEALRLSGRTTLKSAIDALKQRGLSAGIVTDGANDVHYFATNDGPFESCDLSPLPVSRFVNFDDVPSGSNDTTGCGDNFAGGVIASLTCQMRRSCECMSLAEAVATGICAGAAARFRLGGVAFEKHLGQQARDIGEIYAEYRLQIKNQLDLPNHFLEGS